MNILSQVNDDNYDIEISIDPDREHCFCATVDGREVEMKIIEVKPSSLTLSIDGRVQFYEFYKEKGRINTVSHDNRFYKVRLRNRQQDQLEQLLEEFGAGMGGTATDTRILAPMPGKILGLNVKEGEKVQLGQVILVLEAMKMENEISSTVEGRVTKINIKVGDTVNNGDVMIETEPL